MKTKAFLAVSLMALTMSTSAFAVSEMNKDYSYRPGTQGNTYNTVRPSDSREVRSVKHGLSEANADMREAADDVRAFFVDEKSTDGRMQPVTISRQLTAEGIIGETILSPNGERIAKIEDIILDRNGNGAKVIVSDGGLLGIGDKLASFDYSRVITQRKDGKVVMALSQSQIDAAKEFSYNRDNYMTASNLPAGAVSVNDLLDGEVYDSNGKDIGDVENLSLSAGSADDVIISFDKTLGMGGKLAALDYDSVGLEKNRGEVNVHLTEGQSRKLMGFKKYASK